MPDALRGHVVAARGGTGALAGMALAGLLMDHAGTVAGYVGGVPVVVTGTLRLLLPAREGTWPTDDTVR